MAATRLPRKYPIRLSFFLRWGHWGGPFGRHRREGPILRGGTKGAPVTDVEGAVYLKVGRC